MSLVGISTDDVAGAQQMAAIVEAGYPILVDPTRQVAIAYGVFDLLGDGVAAPAVFIVNPDRTIRWSFIGKAVADRPSNEDILARIR